MTLGEQLQQRLDSEHADKTKRLLREAQESGEKELVEYNLVKDFFETIKSYIVEDISNGKAVRKITLGDDGRKNHYAKISSIFCTYNWNNPANTVENKSHKYYPLWQQFDQWAKSEKLDIKWEYQWDGGGISSWHILKVEPIKS